MRKTNGPLNKDFIFSPLCYNQQYFWWLIPQFIKTKAFLVPLDMINIYEIFFDDFDVIMIIIMYKVFYMRIFRTAAIRGMYLTFQLVLGTAALQEAEIANNILESHFHRIDITKGSVGWWTTRHSFGQVLNFGCVRWKKKKIFVYISDQDKRPSQLFI